MIKQALIKKLEGDIEVAKADLQIFLEKQIGVAEHIDYISPIEKELEKLSAAKGKLVSLRNIKFKLDE